MIIRYLPFHCAILELGCSFLCRLFIEPGIRRITGFGKGVCILPLGIVHRFYLNPEYLEGKRSGVNTRPRRA
jgi:hypothetical protein